MGKNIRKVFFPEFVNFKNKQRRIITNRRLLNEIIAGRRGMRKQSETKRKNVVNICEIYFAFFIAFYMSINFRLHQVAMFIPFRVFKNVLRNQFSPCHICRCSMLSFFIGKTIFLLN